VGSLFSKPKKVALPPVPAPPALPDTTDEAGDESSRRIRSRSGFQSTLITGALTPQTGKKTLLG